MSTRWTGAESRRERAKHAPTVRSGAAVCPRCGRPILPGQSWEPDHWPVAREFGGTETVPAHARCNRSAGGKRGALITNSRRRRIRRPATPSKNIRGI